MGFHLLLRVVSLAVVSAYTDHADKDATWVAQQVDLSEQSGVKKTAGGPKVTFPIRLHDMLTDVESKNQTSIVSWLPHGRAFKVHDRRAFMTNVLPFHFKYHSSFALFQKQLNAYGYIRLVGQHDDQNAYYHELFLRGRSYLCALMSRQGTKHSERYTYNPATEPNLYGMKRLEDSEVVVVAAAAATVRGDQSHSVALGRTAVSSYGVRQSSLSPIPLMDNSQAEALERYDLSSFLNQAVNEQELTTQSANQNCDRPVILAISEHSHSISEQARGTVAAVYPASPLATSIDIQGLPIRGATGTSADDSMFQEYRSSHSVSSTSLGVDLFDDQSILSNDGSLSLSCGSTS